MSDHPQESKAQGGSKASPNGQAVQAVPSVQDQAEAASRRRNSLSQKDRARLEDAEDLFEVTSYVFDPDRWDQPDWIVDGLLVPGKPAAIGGPLKSMKTSLALDLAISFATGTPFLGKFKVRRMPAMMLFGENDDQHIGRLATTIAQSKGINDPDTKIWNLITGFRMPRFGKKEELVQSQEAAFVKAADIL